MKYSLGVKKWYYHYRFYTYNSNSNNPSWSIKFTNPLYITPYIRTPQRGFHFSSQLRRANIRNRKHFLD
jgi:hypothetical protein